METLFIGKNTIFLSDTVSTNSYAMELLKNVNLPEGTLVHAAHQTQGRGQRGSRWVALPDESLTVSVVLKPTFLEPKNQFLLYQIAALASHDTIAQFIDLSHYDIKIKWPNDILVNHQKICGILIENSLSGEHLNWCVMGIGVNVKLKPQDDLPQMVSMQACTSRLLKPADLIEPLCMHLERYYLQIKNGHFEQIRLQYVKRLFALGEWRRYVLREAEMMAKIDGISEQGFLRMEGPEGVFREVDVKEVRYLF